MRSSAICTTLVIFFATTAFSQEIANTCEPARHDGKSVSLGISPSVSPYVMPETDGGIEIDIAREAMAHTGYRVCPRYLPTSRAAQNFSQGQIDGLFNVSSSLYNGHVSDVILEFHNCAFSLAKSGLEPLSSIGDLTGHSVAAFQLAAILLEPEFARTVQKLSNYYEVPDQQIQLYLLFRERVDFILLDERIFTYYYRKLLTQAKSDDTPIIPLDVLKQPVQKHCVFQSSASRIEFADERLRDDFNIGLQYLKDSGRYQEIFNQYLN